MKANETQLKLVMKHIIKVGEITSWTAITKYRITRLSEYIRILRDDYGWDIETIKIYPPDANWFGVYKLK